MATLDDDGHSVYDNVVDQYGRPVASALVTIRDSEGALVNLGQANPIVTDSTGYWECDLDPGTYTLVISKGDDSITRELVVCQRTGVPFITEISTLEEITVLAGPITQSAEFDLIVLDLITLDTV